MITTPLQPEDNGADSLNKINANNTAIEAAIEEVVNDGAPLASTTVAGRAKLSAAPADAADPIAVGDNDTRLPSADLQAAQAGGGDFGTPSADNKFLTELFLTNKPPIQRVYERADSPATWTKPTGLLFAHAVVVAGGGGGGKAGSNNSGGSGGGDGGNSSFGSLITALGGLGGRGGSTSSVGRASRHGFCSGNGGQAGTAGGTGSSGWSSNGSDGLGGEIKTGIYTPDLLASTVTITVGAGGTGASGSGTVNGGAGGAGRVIVTEYYS